MRVSGVALLIAGLLVVSGCGLQDYESRMEYEQKRVKYYEEENQNLEPKPITWPAPKEKKDLMAKEALFFRPPKEVSTTPEDTPLGPLNLFFRYPAKKTSGFEDMLVAPLMSFKGADKLKQSILEELGMNGLKPTPKEMGQRSGRPVPFELYRDTAANAPYLYVHRNDPFLVLVLFRPGEQNPGAERLEALMDYSLGSLLTGNAATQRHGSWRPPAPAPAAPNTPSRP
jgi:hypothetical protein